MSGKLNEKFINDKTYRNTYKWPKGVVWINNMSNWAYESILRDYVKKKHWKMCKVGHQVIFEYFG